MTIECLQVVSKRPRWGGGRHFKWQKIEGKDDGNKSNDHHQISNHWSERWSRGSEKAPSHWSAFDDSDTQLKCRGQRTPCKLALKSLIFVCWFVSKYAPGLGWPQVLLPQGYAAFEPYFLPGLSSTCGCLCDVACRSLFPWSCLAFFVSNQNRPPATVSRGKLLEGCMLSLGGEKAPRQC